MKLIVGSLLHAVKLVIFHFRQVSATIFHHNVASRAGATSAAGVLEMESEVHCNIEQRSRLSVSFIFQCPRFELERLACGQERNLWQAMIIPALPWLQYLGV